MRNTPAPPSAAALLHMVNGYQTTQALWVAARLGLADLLATGPRSSEELARMTGTHASSLHRLLRALAAFDLFEELAPGQFALTPLGAYLRTDTPDSLRDLVLMRGSENFWQSWGDLLHCVQTGQSAVSHLFGTDSSFDYYARNPEVAAIVRAGMSVQARIGAAAVVGAYAFPRSGTVIDIGGGYGQFLATLLETHPGLQGILFDLPHLEEGAIRRLGDAGVLSRCRVVVGDFFQAVPPGGDIYLLSRVIHDWDDERAVAILKNCRRAMTADAKLLLLERVLPPLADASVASQQQLLSDLNMLVRTGGRERTADEYSQLFTAAGFRLSRILSPSSSFSLLEVVPA